MEAAGAAPASVARPMTSPAGPAADAPVSMAPRARHIVIAWLLAAAVSTPASFMISAPAAFSVGGLLLVFAQMLAHFAPWALSTPLFVRLSRAWPIGVGRVVLTLLVFGAGALVLTPLLSGVGVLAGRVVVGLARGGLGPEAFAAVGPAVAITTFFALPTYAALVGVGQTVAFLERYRQRERLLSQAQVQALRAQIAPHFLFNALNAIAALGYRDPGRADQALVRLSELLRETLARPEHVSVREEVSMVADYVELHRILLEERLVFDLEVQASAWDARVPAMILQPLIENAVVHGVSRLPEGGAITLAVSEDGGVLTLAVVNDAPAEPGPPGKGLGLENVRGRLAVTYGDRAALAFERSAGSARAVVTLPLESAAA